MEPTRGAGGGAGGGAGSDDAAMPVGECMVAECMAAPDSRLIVDSGGVLLVFAVCAEHKRANASGYLFAAPVDLRGFIGLAVAD